MDRAEVMILKWLDRIANTSARIAGSVTGTAIVFVPMEYAMKYFTGSGISTEILLFVFFLAILNDKEPAP